MATSDEANRALVAVRAGADDYTAAAYAGLEPRDLYQGELGDAIHDAKTELAIYATSVIRQAMGSSPGLAQRYLDKQAAEREVQWLHEVAEEEEA